MVAIKSLILPAFIFFEGVQSYCIYNQLDDASFYIIHRYENYVPYRKYISFGAIIQFEK